MNLRSKLSPGCVDATYIPSRIPQFAGHPLIEALPPALEPEDALAAYASAPSYSPEQRVWKVSERLQMLKTLSNFLTPFERHIAYSTELDSMLRNGYIGRAPATPEYIKRRQAIYDQSMAVDDGGSGGSAGKDDGHQLSLLLIGLSGMGKTRFTKRWASRYPTVIYHPELHVYQIPVLHIELPSDGESVKGLCIAILRAVDKVIPSARYVEDYAMKGRPTTEMLILRVETVLHLHCVGMLICDEVQNLTNAGKTKDRLMTELVSMSNILNLPLVFIGTNTSASLFGRDFRKARRSAGFGSQHWDRLLESQRLDDGRVISEWRDFVEVMWTYQWTKTPTPLTEELLTHLYWCCQGVVDTAIKMYAAAQARAILYGTELVTKELLMDVYQKDFQVLHPMLAALRENDVKALAQFEDVQPLGLSVIIDNVSRRAKSVYTPALTVTPSNPNFVAQVTTALHATGFPLDTALEAAHEVASEGKAKHLLHATQLAAEKLTPHASPKRAGTGSRALGKGRSGKGSEPDYTGRPQDLRGALQFAKRSGQDILSVMFKRGAIKPLEELLDLGIGTS
jgi:hypothetical protein